MAGTLGVQHACCPSSVSGGLKQSAQQRSSRHAAFSGPTACSWHPPAPLVHRPEHCSSTSVAAGVACRAAAASYVPNRSVDEMQQAPHVAYQGQPGSFSEIAAYMACPDLEMLPCSTFEAAFQTVEQWKAERAVLPVQNSLGGSIHAVYDLMLRHRLYITAEVDVPINQCLLALPGVKKEDVRRVLSRSQAISQADNYLRQLPGVVREAVDSTAAAAKLIAENGWRDAAAVGSRRAAEMYGLEVLEENIQDQKDNVTRFLVLSRDPTISTDAASREGVPYKTSVVCSMKEGPGMLFKALSVFALRDINLTHIESRPRRSEPLSRPSSPDGGNTSSSVQLRSFNYLFYIDFEGALFHETAQNALRHLKEICTFVRVLGSYPADTSNLI